MSTTRVVALYRELSRVQAELADAIEADDVDAHAAPSDKPSVPRAKRPAPTVRLVRPEGENDELARRKAQTFLRRNGYTKANR